MRLLLKVAVLFGVMCGTMWAQTSPTSLRGTVTDPSGAVVPGARIELANQANGQKQTQVAGSGGEYQFQQVVPGTYLLTATAGGFFHIDSGLAKAWNITERPSLKFA